MKYIFLSTFIIFSVIHLYASLKVNKPLRNVTKGFILFSLLSWYILSVTEPSWIVVIAIIMSWLGDILLIPHGTKWFAAGGIAFMISHIFFIIGYSSLTDFTKVPVIVIALLALLFLVAVILIFRKLSKYLNKALIVPMFLYLLVNGAMNCFSIFRAISSPTVFTILTMIGALSFFISDTSLFFVRFNKESKMKTHFLVMITYIIAEYLIIQGFIWM